MPEPNTFKPVTDTVKQAVTDVSKQIQGLGADITGKIRATFDEDIEELVSWGENAFGRIKQVFAPFLSSMGQWFLQTKLMKSSTGFLKKLVSIEEWNKKRQRMQQGLTKKSLLMDILRGLGMFFGMAMGGAGALLGAILAPILGPIIKPIEILGKVFSAFKMRMLGIVKWIRNFSKDPFGLGKFKQEGGIVKRIKNLFGPEGRIGKLLEPIRNMFSKEGIIGKVSSMFKGIKLPPSVTKSFRFGLRIIGKILGLFVKAGKWIVGSPIFKMFGGVFMKSLNKIFWPLQIITSVIDFIKGFMDTQGDIVDKIYGGIANVLKEFFGYPIALLGKLIDWIAEKFGFENLGAEKFLTEGFDKLVDTFISIPLWFKDLFKGWIMDAIEVVRDSDISGIFQPIFDFFERIKDKIIIGLWKYINNSPLLQKILSFAGGGDFLKSLEDKVKNAEEKEMTEYEKQRLEQEKQKLELAKKQTGGSQQVIIQNSESNSGGQPPPDSTSSSRWLNAGAEAGMAGI